MPLDVAIFHPLKHAFYRSNEHWKKLNGISTKLDDVTEIIETPWEEAHLVANIKAGFKKAGISPLQLNWMKNNPRIFTINGEKPSSNKI